MAIINDQHHKDGIQLGGPLDYCEVCSAKSRRFDYGELEYKEVFKFYRNGNSICFCMDHFKSMLGHYLLVDLNEDIKDEEEEIIENNEDTVEDKKEKVSKEKTSKKNKSNKSKK